MDELEDRAKRQAELNIQIAGTTYEVGRLLNAFLLKEARKALDSLLTMIERRDRLIQFKTAEEERLWLIRQMEAGYH